MTPSEHFLRHAAECKFMAQLARDKQSKATWMGMAERWNRCAELAKQQSVNPSRAKEARHRKAVKTWSH
jgi:hypothetical protein